MRASLTMLARRPPPLCALQRSMSTAASRATLVLHRRGPSLLGQPQSNWLRKQGRTPGCLIGDKLPQMPFWVEAAELDKLMRKPFFETRLLNLEIDGEIHRALPAEIMRLGSKYRGVATHITLQRWPRDPEKNPIKRCIHTVLTNELKCPEVKAGAYIHEMFARNGVPVYLRDPDHLPETLLIDMARADKGDIRMEHIDLPAGVSVRLLKGQLENCIVARAKRIRGG